jgi:hypothetical protein
MSTAHEKEQGKVLAMASPMKCVEVHVGVVSRTLAMAASKTLELVSARIPVKETS